MLQTFIRNLENKNHPLLGPTLWGLLRWGLWQPKRGISSKIYNMIHFCATLFIISQYVELWFLRSNVDLALRNLSVTMLSTVCVVKAITFVFWQENWKNVIEYISSLERKQLSRNCEKTSEIIRKYTKYSRQVTYFFWVMSAATVMVVILAPLAIFWSSKDIREEIRNGHAPYPEIISSWTPFDRTRGFGYWASIVEHTLLCLYGAGVIATYDANAVVIMSFIVGQLNILSEDCSRLFHDEEMNAQDKIKSIRECHNHHLNLIKYSKIMNSLLSPVMFLYVIICSLMLCASAIQITTEGTTSMQRIWIAEYLAALITQLFLYCWHGNEVLVKSDEVAYGIYKSAWWSQNVRIKRCVLLLGGQLRKQIVFTAGPFTRMNLSTFFAILKGSYSYYTILSRK